jgi:hypothetical protein
MKKHIFFIITLLILGPISEEIIFRANFKNSIKNDKLFLLGEQSRRNKICNWSTRGKDYSLTINEGDILANRQEGSLIKLLKEKMNYSLLDSYGILTLNDFPDLKIKLFYIRMDNYIYSYVK